MKALTLEEIKDRIGEIEFEEFDKIVAIGKGGIVPSLLLANELNLKMQVMWLSFRDKDNKVVYEKPKLIKRFNGIKNERILLVDDVSRSGKTLEEARKILNGNKIKTLVVNGKADYSLFNFKECVKFPWGMI
ncbi:phosphoribosyltransferase [Candidatus Woesearchaeota archaeon]|nr:phosphoribosyltransferase [Candidatus Woesearchaeota archaeon]